MSEIWNRRFGGIVRLYGAEAAAWLREAHFCVVGIGGVGSWAAEALARSGVGRLTLIDFDEVCETNINRQVLALTETVSHKKVQVMADRIGEINPECRCDVIDDFLTVETLDDYLGRGYDYVIDAIDSIKFKAAMIAWCRRRKVPVIATGGAGGLSDPAKITITDLSRTVHDPLAAKVRSRLRDDYGLSKNSKRRFGVECVFSTQQPVYPRVDGTVSCEKPGIHGVSLDCRLGYGAVTMVTASFGLMAAGRAVNKYIEARQRRQRQQHKDS